MGNLVLDLGQGRMFEWHVKEEIKSSEVHFTGYKIQYSLTCDVCSKLCQNWNWPVGLSFSTCEMTTLAIRLFGGSLFPYPSATVFLSLSENEYLIIYTVWNSSNRGKEYSPTAKKPLPVKFKQSFMYYWVKCYFWRTSPFFSSSDVTSWAIGIV